MSQNKVYTPLADYRSQAYTWGFPLVYRGSVKANIGHLEGASGLAGIVKTVLVLENGTIPPNANFNEINPNIDAKSYNVQVSSEFSPRPGRSKYVE